MAVNFNLQSILVEKEVDVWLRDTATGRVDIRKLSNGQNKSINRDDYKLAKHWIQLINFQIYQRATQSQPISIKSENRSLSAWEKATLEMVAIEADFLREDERQLLIEAKLVDKVAVNEIPSMIEKLQKKVEEDQKRIKEKNLGFSHIFHIRAKSPESSSITYLIAKIYCKIQKIVSGSK